MVGKAPLIGWGGTSLKDLREIKGDLVFVLGILESETIREKRKPEVMTKLMELKRYYDIRAKQSEGYSSYSIDRIIEFVTKKQYKEACKAIIEQFEVLNNEESTMLGPRVLERIWDFFTGWARKKESPKEETEETKVKKAA